VTNYTTNTAENQPDPVFITVLDGRNYTREVLAKRWQFEDGRWSKVADSSTGKHRDFLAHRATIVGIDGLHELLQALRDKAHACIVRGRLIDDAKYLTVGRTSLTCQQIDQHVVRRTIQHQPAFFESQPTRYVGFDIDELELPPGLDHGKHAHAVAEWCVVECLPPCFHDASYVFHLSGSAGFRDRHSTIASTPIAAGTRTGRAGGDPPD
jgi:hypothetical protein